MSRFFLNPIFRVSVGLLMLTISILLMGDWLGLVPNATEAQLENRRKFSESLAVQLSSLASTGDSHHINTTLEAVVARNPDVLAARFRSDDGGGEMGSGDAALDGAARDKVIVPIFQGDRQWGSVEVQFAPTSASWLPGFANNTFLALVAFVFALGMLLFPVFLKRVLRELDPSRVIPGRVKAAFDTLAEGILILDEQGDIMLANNAFTRSVSIASDNLVGKKASSLRWIASESSDEEVLPKEELPWNRVLATGEEQTDACIAISHGTNTQRAFAVNCTPIHDDKRNVRGVIATFDDLTELQEKNAQLSETLVDLQKSKEAVDQKSKELEFLATRDPMTGCLNRRAFNEYLEERIELAKTRRHDLVCMMVDIDHFKRINDNYGHAMGDTVIKFVADTIQAKIRPTDLLARYGGEEFCLVLDDIDLERARVIAERIRLAVMEGDPSSFASTIKVTSSFGLSLWNRSLADKEELINNADRALYRAKESGRNRVLAWEDGAPSAPKKAAQKSVAAGSATDFGAINVNQDVENRLEELEQIAREKAEQLDHLLSHDSVTDLPGRGVFLDRVEQSVLRAKRSNDIPAVLSLGLNDLGRVNDTLGYGQGEQLLLEVATRLKKVLRESDTVASISHRDEDEGALSKLGQGEFGILVASVRDKESITWIVRRIFDALREPIYLDGHSLVASCSIGISIFPDDGESGVELIKRANISRYHAEQLPGSNNVEYFSREMGQRSRQQLNVESELSGAVDDGQFDAFYQPKIALESNQICGFEALLRWRHPERGLLAPGDFIDVAERTRHINAIGDWILEQACRHIQRCKQQTDMPVTVAVNMSPVQWSQEDLVKRIISIVEKTGTRPEELEIELTESCLMENLDRTLASLKALRNHGFSISVDDFGTGYSALGYLRDLPIDTLKIDRCFVSELDTSNADLPIVEAIISMARALHLRIVAEGVENETQLEILRELGCHHAQGYYFSRPVPADEALAMLPSRARSAPA
ncbi:MAG: diguanylate cyclase [Halieaceae bacterium]|nr:diguanylate cyclase [Halieaceae bacterium]